jgi:23S rRNA G2445 N2-methylase RlmL
MIKRPQAARIPIYQCEAEVIHGLEAFARDEIARRLGKRARMDQESGVKGTVRFTYDGDLKALLALQTITAIYLVRLFRVPRPRALLGHEHLHALVEQINAVRSLFPPRVFESLHIDAAGSDSSIMRRLRDELQAQTGLRADPDSGDLLIRLRRPPDGTDGWEALIRLSPRPLATRAWRVCNFEGALNATVAHAMGLMTRPSPDDVFLNVACGSGSLLIERLACAPAQRVIGCDIDPSQLECARTNITASGFEERIELLQCDAGALPLESHSVDALCADLPFGQLVGTHAHNRLLYPVILEEAARVIKPEARFVVITHEVRLMESILSQSPRWSTESVTMITLRGLHPRIFLLVRR